MRFAGGIRPFRSQKVRFGATPGVKILWDNLTGTLGTIFAGDAFNYTFTATSSDNNVVYFSLQSGTLPTGVTLNPATGILSGVSTSPGMYAFVIRASAGKTTMDRAFSINTRAITVAWTTPASLGSIPAGISSVTNLTAVSSDNGPVTYTLQSGILPVGMALSPAGSVVGKPDNVGGTATFTIRATRKTGISADRTFNLNILPDVVTWGTAAGTLATIIGGNPFDQTVTATSNQTAATLTYSIVYGDLPAGLTLNGSTGRISGTAQNLDGSSVFRIRASDGYGYADREFTLVVNADVITWNTASGILASLNGGQSILGTLSATSNISGRLVNQYQIVSGALPGGLSLNGATGSISGTATNLDAQAQFIVRATDGIGFADRAFQINVLADAIVWETQPQVTFNSGEPVATTQLRATSLSAEPVSYERTAGEVPEGFTFDTTNATITGASNRAVSTTLSVRARNARTFTDRTFTVAVNGAPIWTTTEGSLGSVLPGQNFNVPLIATDPDGIGSYTFVGDAPNTVSISKTANTGSLNGYVTTTPDLFPPTWLSSPVFPTLNEGFQANTTVTALPGTSGRVITRYETVKGTLPWGLTMTSAGLITGAGQVQSDEPFAPLQPTPIFSTPSNLGTKNEGDLLSVTMQATPQLGNVVVSYAYVRGQMPWGVTMNSQTGVLSGTIADIEPADNPISGTPPRWMTANTSPIATLNETDTLPNGVILEALSTSNSGIKAYTLQSGTIPWGTTLGTKTGILSGTAGFIEQDGSFTSAPGPIFITAPALGDFDEGAALNRTLLATPVTGNVVQTYAFVSGQLPWGLSVDSTGVISGTVGQIEPTVDPLVFRNAPVWLTNSSTLFVGDELQTVATSVQANSANLAAYTISNGALPWGVTLNSKTGALSGQIGFIEVDETSVLTNPPVWMSNAALGTLNEGSAFTATVVAKTYTGNAISQYAFVSGQLPWGVTVASTGTISGMVVDIEPNIDPIVYLTTPVWQTVANTVVFTGEELYPVSSSVSATGNGLSYAIANGALPWGVALNSQTGALTGTALFVERDEDTALPMNPPSFVTPPGLLGTLDEGTLLSSTIAASPGARGTSVSLGLVGGSLPWGVSLDQTGLLSGTIQNVEPVADAVVMGTPPSFTTPAGSLGTFANTAVVSTTVSATLANATVKYAVQTGTLPWGVLLDSSNGTISGTLNPTDDANRAFAFSIRAFTVNSGYTDRAFSITVQ